MLHLKAGAVTIFGSRKLLLRNLASHGQNRTDFFDLAVEDRFGGQ
jgi:hypothetical protein